MAREADWKTDRPKVGTNQSQCPHCGRIFENDGLCEKQKRYARLPGDNGTGRIAERDYCTPPEDLGMVARERDDGIIIWSMTSDEAYAARMALMEKARVARKAKTGKR